MFSNLVFFSAVIFAGIGSYLALKKKPYVFSSMMMAFALVATPELNERVSVLLSPLAGDIVAWCLFLIPAILITGMVDNPNANSA